MCHCNKLSEISSRNLSCSSISFLLSWSYDIRVVLDAESIMILLDPTVLFSNQRFNIKNQRIRISHWSFQFKSNIIACFWQLLDQHRHPRYILSNSWDHPLQGLLRHCYLTCFDRWWKNIYNVNDERNKGYTQVV